MLNRCRLLVASLLLLAATPSIAQTINLDRADVKGTIRFSANDDFVDGAPPDILTDLWTNAASRLMNATNLEGQSSSASTSSFGPGGPAVPSPPPFNDTVPPVDYQLIFDEAQGETFVIKARATFDQGRDTYIFSPITTDALQAASAPYYIADCDPAPGIAFPCLVDQDFDECAGVVYVRFFRDGSCSSSGQIFPDDPNYPQMGGVEAFTNPVPELLATTVIVPNKEVRFPVQAAICPGAPHADPAQCLIDLRAGPSGQNVRLDIRVTQGSDIFSNRVNTYSQRFVDVLCNKITIVDVFLPCPFDSCPNPPCGGSSSGDLTGEWQFLGPDPGNAGLRFEEQVVYNTSSDIDKNSPQVRLDDGPDDNARYARVLPPIGTTAPNYPALANYIHYNTPFSSRPHLANDENYRVRSFHFLNDSPPGQPCGPNVGAGGGTPCGLVGLVYGNVGDGFELVDPTYTNGEILWEACVANPSGSAGPAPPIAPMDGEQDWIYIDNAADILYRCSQLTGADPTCPQVLNPGALPAGGDPLDIYKPFVMQPGVVRGTLMMRDGSGGSQLLDVLENLETSVSLLDPQVGTRFETYFDCYGVEDPDFRSGINTCSNRSADGLTTHDEGRYIGSLREIAAPPTDGRRDFMYRIVPAQMSNVSGFYETDRIRLKFFDDDLDANLYWNGAVYMDNDVLDNGRGTSIVRNIAQPSDQVQNLDRCLGKIRVVLNSQSGAPFYFVPGAQQHDRPWIQGHNTAWVQAQAGQETQGWFDDWTHDNMFAGTVMAANPMRAVVNIATVPGSYVLEPSVKYTQTIRTFYPEASFLQCDVTCGGCCIACDSYAPSCDSVTTVPPFPTPVVLDADCAGTVDVTLCLFDCQGGDNPQFTVTPCTDDGTLPGATAPPSTGFCPTGFDFVLPAVVVQTNQATQDPCGKTECSPTLSPITLPIGQGAGGSFVTQFVFHIEDFAVPPQTTPLSTIGCPIAVNSLDNTAPLITCPLGRVQCIMNSPLHIDDLCATLHDDACSGEDVDGFWYITGATVACSATTPCMGTCVDADFNCGHSDIHFVVVDAAGNRRECTTPVDLYSGPTASFTTTPNPVCRNVTPGQPVSVTLDATSTSPDRCADNLPDNLQYAWSLLNCNGGTLTSTTGQVSSVSIADTAGNPCQSIATCEVQLQVTEIVSGAPSCLDTTTRTITINPRPIAVATGGSACKTPPSTSIPLNGGSSMGCDGATITAYAWSFVGSCPGGSITNPAAAVTNFVYVGTDPAITCTVQLEVTDNRGCHATTTTTVNVLAQPTVDAGPNYTVIIQPPTGPNNSCAQLDGTATTTKPNCALQLQWTTTCNNGFFLPSAQVEDPNFCINMAQPTTCQVCLTATDCDGCVAMDCSPVTVRNR